MDMATIKAIEANSVHQIQSGQVIVDFCSVAKELVENSIDAGATSIEVRFKNNGLDLIEVQDNGNGIAPENYENIALKHYTSKLSSFEDLSRLQTFGFRGEALSSLCALSDFRVVTAQANQAPKANKLEFEPSGKLESKKIVAGQKGTTVSVENLFKKLPVRRRELEKNIKREYGKVLNLLHAYACISTGARFSVKNTAGKNRNVVVFATNGNQTTKENIANVYGAKTLSALISLDLALDFEPSTTTTTTIAKTAAENEDEDESNSKIFVRGHISRPVFGEGRQTPDRQMFFVNSRPCGLPQIAKAFNEVYKSFNVSQSPFIFADFHMDTNSYDVNVSPDKRTILLHDAGALIEALKTSLTEMFDNSDQTVPQSQVLGLKQPSIKQQHLHKSSSQATAEFSRKSSELDADVNSEEGHDSPDDEEEKEESSQQLHVQSRLKSFLSGQSNRPEMSSSSPGPDSGPTTRNVPDPSPAIFPEIVESSRQNSDLNSDTGSEIDRDDEGRVEHAAEEDAQPVSNLTPPSSAAPNEHRVPSVEPDEPAETPNTIQDAFDRMRPKRPPAEVATITVGNKTVTSIVGSGVPRKRDAEPADPAGSASPRQAKRRVHTPSHPNIFSQHMKAFAAPGSQMAEASANDDGEREMDDDVEDGRSDDQVFVSQSSTGGRQSISLPADAEDRNLSDDNAVDGDDNMVVNDNEQVSVAPGDNEVDEEKKRADEEARVQQLIRDAEQGANLPEEHSINRANKLNKGGVHRDSTVHLIGTVDGSLSRIQRQLEQLQDKLRLPFIDDESESKDDVEKPSISQATGTAAEDRLSLTVTKGDFDRMHIIGQFNLGFILATRSREKPKPPRPDSSDGVMIKNDDDDDDDDDDELFIIDQHASDEKFNFERLQSETAVQNQRLVQPKTLDLTAVEEEVVLENQAALEKNGFVIEIDDSGNEPIGRRCKLVSLPLSKEVVFGVRDLEELIVLLSESPLTDAHKNVPRPSKVRKMFAMRACRSSIMVGKNLTQKQMEKVVRNMGTIDKPWNCPHGRPTMRHLVSLGGWNEWDEFRDGENDDDGGGGLGIWKRYFGEMAELDGEEEEEESE